MWQSFLICNVTSWESNLSNTSSAPIFRAIWRPTKHTSYSIWLFYIGKNSHWYLNGIPVVDFQHNSSPITFEFVRFVYEYHPFGLCIWCLWCSPNYKIFQYLGFKNFLRLTKLHFLLCCPSDNIWSKHHMPDWIVDPKKTMVRREVISQLMGHLLWVITQYFHTYDILFQALVACCQWIGLVFATLHLHETRQAMWHPKIKQNTFFFYYKAYFMEY